MAGSTFASKVGRRVRTAIRGEEVGDGVVVTFEGAHILARPTNKIEHRLLSGEAYDAANFAAVDSVVGPGMVCFDIGANIGVYTAVLARRVGESGSVHAFEPVSHIRRRLRTNVALNGVRNVVVNAFALGEEPGELEMLQVKESVFRGGTSTFLRNDNVREMGDDCFEKEAVQIDTLDRYVDAAGLERLDFIKLDVEGFEIYVLKGGIRAITKFRPAILFEHDQDRLAEMGFGEESIASLFRDNGYVCYEIQNRHGQTMLTQFDFDRRLSGNNLLALNIGE